MLSQMATALVPAFGRLTTSADLTAVPAPGILVANHTSLADPGVVLAALRRMDIEPVVLATAGLWRVPVLSHLLNRDGHVPVHRRTSRAAEALETAAAALAAGRHVLIYGEGRIPPRRDASEAAPEAFRSGPARLAAASGACLIPVGQAGARRLPPAAGSSSWLESSPPPSDAPGSTCTSAHPSPAGRGGGGERGRAPRRHRRVAHRSPACGRARRALVGPGRSHTHPPGCPRSPASSGAHGREALR